MRDARKNMLVASMPEVDRPVGCGSGRDESRGRPPGRRQLCDRAVDRLHHQPGRDQALRDPRSRRSARRRRSARARNPATARTGLPRRPAAPPGRDRRSAGGRRPSASFRPAGTAPPPARPAEPRSALDGASVVGQTWACRLRREPLGPVGPRSLVGCHRACHRYPEPGTRRGWSARTARAPPVEHGERRVGWASVLRSGGAPSCPARSRRARA